MPLLSNNHQHHLITLKRILLLSVSPVFIRSLYFFFYSPIHTSFSPSLPSLYQLNRQNRSLKRKSMLLFSHLSPETIAKISLEDDQEEEEEGEDPGSKVCVSVQCQATISGTRSFRCQPPSLPSSCHWDMSYTVPFASQ